MNNHYKLISRSKPKPNREFKVYRTKAKMKLWQGDSAAWHFITLSVKLSDQIKRDFGGMARGWGSIPVEAQVGKTSWKTSIFPDSKSGAYLLPVKADIRKKEMLKAGELVALSLSI